MRFFRKIAGFLGFSHDKDGDNHNDDPNHNHSHNQNNNENNNSDPTNPNRVFVDPIPGPRKGFSVPVQVAVDRPSIGPVLIPCNGDGGLQGLGWYAKRTRVDEDGDVGDEFIEEVLPDMSGSMQDEQKKSYPRFQVKHNVRYAKVKDQMISKKGKFMQCVEHQGKLQWV